MRLVVIGPAVNPRAEAADLAAQFTASGCQQRFVRKQVDAIGLFQGVIAVVGAPGAAECGAESPVDLVQRLTGEVCEVPQRETALGGSEVSNDVNLEPVALQLVEQFLSG